MHTVSRTIVRDSIYCAHAAASPHVLMSMLAYPFVAIMCPSAYALRRHGPPEPPPPRTGTVRARAPLEQLHVRGGGREGRAEHEERRALPFLLQRVQHARRVGAGPKVECQGRLSAARARSYRAALDARPAVARARRARLDAVAEAVAARPRRGSPGSLI